MAYPSREAVFSALYAKLSKLVQFNHHSRKVVLPIDVTDQHSPMLILWEGNQESTYDANRLDKEEWDAWVIIYFKKPDKSVPGSTIINPLIDAVRDALSPDNKLDNVLVLKDTKTGKQLASWVRVEGRTVVENGDTDSDGVGGAIIPIKMLVP